MANGAVWAANTEDHTVSRIDPDSRQVVRTIAVDELPSDLAAGERSVWVGLGPSASLTRISSQNVATRALPALGDAATCGTPGSSIAAYRDAVWFACEFADLGRLDPASGSSKAVGYERACSRPRAPWRRGSRTSRRASIASGS